MSGIREHKFSNGGAKHVLTKDERRALIDRFGWTFTLDMMCEPGPSTNPEMFQNMGLGLAQTLGELGWDLDLSHNFEDYKLVLERMKDE